MTKNMNDRYLYRAKRTDNGEWITWNILTGIPHDAGIFGDTVCACTGLKDKNDKLIWENDIMVAHLDDSFPEDTTYARVVWNNNGFCTKEQGSNDISPLDKFDQEYFEVCGNLFDTPELLEVGE